MDIKQTIKLGSKGDEVAILQKWLLRHGYFTDKNGNDLIVDGIFGPKTKLAVLFAQSESGIKEDGIVGPITISTFTARDQCIDTNTNPKYTPERYNPLKPLCVGASLYFNGTNLILRHRGGTIRYLAVSGMPQQGGEFNYSRISQTSKDIGPIPEGSYWINPSELWKNRWWSPRRRSSWGNYAITIHPFTSTITHARGGFFIHGGTTPGSKGCIDLTLSMDKFVNDLLQAVGDTPDCTVTLTVKYNTPW